MSNTVLSNEKFTWSKLPIPNKSVLTNSVMYDTIFLGKHTIFALKYPFYSADLNRPLSILRDKNTVERKKKKRLKAF